MSWKWGIFQLCTISGMIPEHEKVRQTFIKNEWIHFLIEICVNYQKILIIKCINQ